MFFYRNSASGAAASFPSPTLAEISFITRSLAVVVEQLGRAAASGHCSPLCAQQSKRSFGMRCYAALLSLLIGPVSSGFTMDEALAIHPDGTPVDPVAFREQMCNGDGELADDASVACSIEDLETFVDYMQQVNADRIFLEDGSARDIKAWRQSVRDDTRYKELLRASFPDMLTMIESGSDTEVQELLMANHNAQLQAMQEEQASRTGKQEL